MSFFTYLLGWNKNPKLSSSLMHMGTDSCNVTSNLCVFFGNHCLVNFLTIKGLTSACKCFCKGLLLCWKIYECDQCFLSSQVLSVISNTHLSIDILIDYRHNCYFSSIVPKDYCMVLIWISESDNLWTLNINWYSETIISFENSFHMD